MRLSLTSVPIALTIFMVTSQLPTLALADSQEIQCPFAIQAESVRISDIKDDWVANFSMPLKLTAAGFMQGGPSMHADLKPYSTRKIPGGTAVAWVFQGAYPNGKWLSCEYANGIASLSKRIADTTSECSVMYGGGKSGAYVVRSITCK